MTINKNASICIIGAGASGIAYWYYLSKAGYRNITLFEKSDCLGGMCKSVNIGKHRYDMGANYVTPYYKEILDIAEEFSLTLRPAPMRWSFDLATGNLTSTLTTTLRNCSTFDFGWGISRYMRALIKYRHAINSPGMTAISNIPVLHHPFGRWLDLNGMSVLKQLFLIPVTIFGYGDLDEVPTPYILKYMNLINFVVLMLVGTVINDITEEESWLFSQILYNNYYVTAAHVEQFPDITIDELQLPPGKPLTPKGHPWGMVKFWPNEDITLYFSKGGSDDNGNDIKVSDINRWIEEDTYRLGGSFKKTLKR